MQNPIINREFPISKPFTEKSFGECQLIAMALKNVTWDKVDSFSCYMSNTDSNSRIFLRLWINSGLLLCYLDKK